jgi:ADP-ribosylglycohydrolase
MIINVNEYRNKVLGCWMGKNIGGTLGAPFEFKRQKNQVTSYTQPLNGNPVPNDDLDIQLLWLIALEEKGVKVNARLLGEYWMLYVTPYWSEFGNAKINMKSGLMPPLSGTENNPFKDSCGAYIRSEIWACIAPGFPDRAARYAYEDAIIDHGNGEGVYAEVFCAALESAAFVESDVRKLIEIGLTYIPSDCGVARAIMHVMQGYDAGQSWEEAREELLLHFRGWAYSWSDISAEDEAKGYREGPLGWDVPINIGITVLGLIYGEGDFTQSICTAVNCGEDTDCTAATIGAIFGIIRGYEAIPKQWIQPIGDKIVTACLNLGELGSYGSQLPANIYELTSRVEQIANQVILTYKLPLSLAENAATELTVNRQANLIANDKFQAIYSFSNGPVYSFDFYNISIDYVEGPSIKDRTRKKLILTIENTYKISEIINVRWYTPDHCTVFPAKQTRVFVSHSWYEGAKKQLHFEIELEQVQQNINRFVVECTLEGRHTAMLVPIVLLNGN